MQDFYVHMITYVRLLCNTENCNLTLYEQIWRKTQALAMTHVFFIRSAERRNIRQAAERRCTRLPQMHNIISRQRLQVVNGTVLVAYCKTKRAYAARSRQEKGKPIRVKKHRYWIQLNNNIFMRLMQGQNTSKQDESRTLNKQNPTFVLKKERNERF